GQPGRSCAQRKGHEPPDHEARRVRRNGARTANPAAQRTRSPSIAGLARWVRCPGSRGRRHEAGKDARFELGKRRALCGCQRLTGHIAEGDPRVTVPSSHQHLEMEMWCGGEP
ncbi:MAG: hypothetical protein ACK55I_01475, partial [bacterium]